MTEIRSKREIEAAEGNREILLSAANEGCEKAWMEIRDTIARVGYDPYTIEDLARRGVAYADLAWAIQLPESEPGHLDMDEVMWSLGRNPDELLDPSVADVLAWQFAEHGQMQTGAFTDYLRSGDVAADIDDALAVSTRPSGLADYVKEVDAAFDVAARSGNPLAAPAPGNAPMR